MLVSRAINDVNGLTGSDEDVKNRLLANFEKDELERNSLEDIEPGLLVER